MDKDRVKAMVLLHALVIGLPTLTYFIERQSCSAKWESFSPRYSFWGGCRIMLDGKYIPSKEYKYMALDNKQRADEK